MTWRLGSELGPALMQDGGVSFTAEKADSEFYQLSGRRIQLGPDRLSPLLAQRAQSTDHLQNETAVASIGYSQATRSGGLDRNFLLILSDVGAHGGGGRGDVKSIIVPSRLVGPSRSPSRGCRSSIPAQPAAGTAGVYRSPSALRMARSWHRLRQTSTIRVGTRSMISWPSKPQRPIGERRCCSRWQPIGGGPVLGYRRAPPTGLFSQCRSGFRGA